MEQDRLDTAIADVAYILDCLRALRYIREEGDCNTCTNKGCGYAPQPGDTVRYNCPFFRQEGEK